MSFKTATEELRGKVAGSFKGIEVLKRGSSPRIVSAEVLGSKGSTLVSGPELAARLGLYDAWAYFSVTDSHGTHKEPDLSGPSTTAPAPAAQPASVGDSGGSSAEPGSEPAVQPASVNGQGGVAAG